MDPASTAPAARAESMSQLLGEVGAVATRLRQNPGFPQVADAVLDLLHRQGPMTVPQIARARATSRQNVQILVDRLETEGRIAILRNPAHKKSSLVVLTARGKTWLETSRHGQEDLSSSMGECCSAEEIQGAIRVLSRIRSLLSATTPDRNRLRRELSTRPESAEESVNNTTTDDAEEFPVSLL